MIHIQKWTNGPSFRITDMTDAGKRGILLSTTKPETRRKEGSDEDEHGTDESRKNEGGTAQGRQRELATAERGSSASGEEASSPGR